MFSFPFPSQGNVLFSVLYRWVNLYYFKNVKKKVVYIGVRFPYINSDFKVSADHPPVTNHVYQRLGKMAFYSCLLFFFL